MNKKGLTLIELIAVLAILSVIALIVTPNIYVSIKNYKKQLYEAQMDNIKEAGKSWTTDNIDKVNVGVTTVGIKELQNGGYLKDKLDNPKDGGYFDDTTAFVLITCTEVSDETESLTTNYKYTYNAYLNVNEYIEKTAIKKAKKDKEEKNITYNLEDLNIVTGINTQYNTNLTIPKSGSVTVTITKEGDNYNYEASFIK